MAEARQAAEESMQKDLLGYVEEHRDVLIELVRDLVRTPSENTPPVGKEAGCQEYCAARLREWGYETEMYELGDVAGLEQHPLFWPGRDYRNRPNVAGRRRGTGGGRSLILSGHIDTVPAGAPRWTRDPFGAEVDGNRLYGRGSNDMKAGVATNLFVARAVRDLGLRLRGDLTVESVVDEEFGGVNGTLAGRLRGYVADGAVISEPSFLRVCPAQRGGLTAHIKFQVPNGGILGAALEQGVAGQVGWFLSQVPEFGARRRAMAPAHPLYAHVDNPVPVSVLKIHTGPWGMGEPMAMASCCQVELFWQSMPGEELEAVKGQFWSWLQGLVERRPDLFAEMPEVVFPLRWLPGAATDREDALVRTMAGCAEQVLGAAPPIEGIEAPCDMFVFNQAFGIPAILWGARGANTHLADEYVELDTVVDSAKALLLLVQRWCG